MKAMMPMASDLPLVLHRVTKECSVTATYSRGDQHSHGLEEILDVVTWTNLVVQRGELLEGEIGFLDTVALSQEEESIINTFISFVICLSFWRVN